MKLALVIALLALTAGSAAAATPSPVRQVAATMSAADFAQALMGAANQYGGDQLANVHCVQGTPRHYMCSYAVLRGARSECHLMQGTWSAETMKIVVTLAGRTQRCATLRDAVHSLR